MKTYWIYEGTEIKVGDVIGGHTVGRLSRSTVYDSDDNPLCSTDWTGRTIGPLAESLSRITIPEAVPFDRVTGKRLHTGGTTSGARVIDVGSLSVLLHINGRPRAADRPLLAEVVDAGVEIRRNPSVSEWLNGLSRVIDTSCAEGRTGCFVIGVGRRRLPAEDAVWTGRTYRLRSEFVADVEGMLRLKSRLPSDWLTLPDGRVCSPHRAVELTHGPSAGVIALVEDCTQVNGGWMLLREMFDVFDRNGYPTRVAEIPSEYVPLASGAYCHPAAALTCEHSGLLFNRRLRVTFEGHTYSQESWEEIGSTCDCCGNRFLRDGHSDCPSCRTESRFRIRNYSNCSANYMPPERDVPIKFGIELEVGCDKGFSQDTCAALLSDAFDSASADPLTYCVYKHDGSLCDCNGFEIVTRPDCPSVHKRIFGNALRDPRLRGKLSSYDNGKCGMHIHVSRAPLNDLWVGRLLVLVNDGRMQPLIHKIAGRSGNRYTQYDDCKKLTSAKRGNDRYEALNVTGAHTVEFRMFRGTLNPTSFIINIEFVEAALAFTRTATRSLRVVGDPRAFIDFVMKERKSYPHLSQFIISKGL